MPEEIPNQQQKQDPGQGFVKKPVETPILDSAARAQISGNPSPLSAVGGFMGFYRANKYYFWAILAGVLIIAFLAYFAFRKPAPSQVKAANVGISVEVPETVASGGEAVYKITVQNNDNQKLTNVELELNYPDGASFESSSPKPENLSGTLFNVPDLIPGQNAALFVKAKVTGNINDSKTLNLKLHYKYSNFNSEFIKEQSVAVRLVASDVSIELQGPANTNNAQAVLYEVKYQNNSDSDVKNARVKLNYPDGFVFSLATPPPDLGTDTWNVGTLAKGASATIEIQGTFSSVNPGESKTAVANFLILGTDGQFFVQNSSTFTTTISSLPLLVSQELSANGSNGIINPGDNLTFSLRYQNNASTAATAANIEVDLNSNVIDPASITAEGGQINNNTISWNASGVPQLASLLPNQSGQLSFSLRVNNPATKDSGKNLTLVSNVKIKANEYDSAFPGNVLNLKVSSPSSISSSLAYISGQLPPQSGKSTTYKVTLSLTNSSNDFSNGTLTAFIPLSSGGFVSGSAGSENKNLQFDPATGKLTWNVGSLPANTGRFSPPRVLTFQIVLNANSSQVGQSPTLVKNIQFAAKDLFTLQDLSVNTDDILTSSLSGSNFGFGSGTVQP